MTNEEEKILDEGNDITLEEAAEEAKELQEETQDEGRAIERREDVDLEGILERQILRGGLRGAADPNMIQKHIDNFLAMLCGETPVDSNVRTSAEYWLKRLATGEGEGSTKKIYIHPITIQKTSGAITYSLSFFIFNNSKTAFTFTTFKEYIDTISTPGSNVRFNCSGGYSNTTKTFAVSFLAKSTDPNMYFMVGYDTTSKSQDYASDTWDNVFGTPAEFIDGVNAIN